MFVKCRLELRGEKSLFSFRFYHEADRNYCKSHDRSILADCDCCSSHGQEKSGIDRMANSSVRTGADELVLFADGYLGAPVFSNVPSRPDCKGDSYDRQNCSQHCNPFPLAEKTPIQDAETRTLRIEQNKPAHHVNHMKQTRERRLPLLYALLITRSPDPVNAKRNPCRLNG